MIALLCLAFIGCGLAAEIDNSLTGEPIVDCQDTQVSLTFNTEKPFNGRVYVKGLSDDDRCSRNFATNTDQNSFSMMIQNGGCNMQRQRMTGAELEGLVFSLTIVVSFHGTFVTKADRAFRCMCFFRNIKRVTNFLDMSMIGTTELLDTVKMPTCTYTIHEGGPEGPLIRYANIGDKIHHVWECDDEEQGFLVHSCWVNDGRGNRFDLLDIDGCAIDPIIQPDVTYESSLTRAHVETHGYKFSDTSVLDYMCVLELCKKAQGECQGLTPPSCGRGKRSINKNRIMVVRNGEMDDQPENQLDVATELNMLDSAFDMDLGLAGPDQNLLNTLNTRVAGSPTYYREQSNDMCLSGPLFGLIVAITVVLALTACVSTFIMCMRARKL